MGHTRGLRRMLPYLVLLLAGFAVPPSVATGAVRSYRTLSPLPAPFAGGLGGLLSVALSVGSRPPGVTWRRALGARTFLHACAQRLSGRLRLRMVGSIGGGSKVLAGFFAEPQRRFVQLAALAAGDARGDLCCLRRRELFEQRAQQRIRIEL